MTRTSRLARAAGSLAVIALPLAVITLSTTPASATTETVCSVVNDQANVFDDNALAEAAANLADTDLHVVSYQSVPGGDIDRAVLDQRDQCSSWQSTTGGGWGRNDLVLAVSIEDRKSALYYGPSFESQLGGNRYRSALDAMGPYFADGDFTTGVLAALDGIEGLIDGTSNTGNPVTSTPSEPLDIPWGWVLGLPGGAIALAGAGFGGAKGRRYLMDRNANRVEANRLTDEAAGVFMELDGLVELHSTRVSQLPEVEDDGILAIRAQAKKATEVAQNTIAAYMEHTEHWTTTAIGDANLADAKAAAANAHTVGLGLIGARNMLGDLDSAITELEAKNALTPKVLDEAQEQNLLTVTVLDELDTDGYKTGELRARVAAYTQRIAIARGWHTENLWGEAADEAAAIAQGVADTYAEATCLRERRAAIDAEIVGLFATQTSLIPVMGDAEALLARLAGAYHSECVEDIRAQVEAGKGCHSDALPTIKDAEVAASMTEQRFADAERIAAQADALLRTATEDFAKPAARQVQLENLVAALPKTVEAIVADTRALADDLSRGADAVKFLDRQPRPDDLREQADRVGSEIAADRPRLLTLDTTAQALAADVTGERQRVATIVREYKAAVALIEKARSAVRDAVSESSRMHAGSHSKSLAATAASELATAERFSSIASATSNANAAISTAATAEQSARSAIAAHEAAVAAEAAERRREAAAAAAASTPSYSSDNGGGGGGSSNFDGGGGSSSW